jgi:8-oxo-dGTP diphosphatase
MDNLEKIYGNRVRVRVCGLCERNGKILMVKHTGVGKNGILWSPPGGGVHFGETLETTLKREIKEEVEMTVVDHEFLLFNEYIDQRYHAIELFYWVNLLETHPTVGNDPELSPEEQILMEADFLAFEQINQIEKGQKHNLFHDCKSLDQLKELASFQKFHNF